MTMAKIKKKFERN